MGSSKKFCPAMWLSGFFALGALVHIARFLLKVSLIVNGKEIPLAASAGIGVLLAVLSSALLAASLFRPCEKKGGPGGEAGHGHAGGCCGGK